MRTRHESRTGNDRRHHIPTQILFLAVDRRWNADQRSHLADIKGIYDPEMEISDDYWATLFKIPSENCL